MRLEPLYTLRFFYPVGWDAVLRGPGGAEEEHFFLAEGEAAGRVAGKFRGANHPHRRADETFVVNLQGVVETSDGATVLADYQGYGRSYPRSQELYRSTGSATDTTPFRRQIVGFAKHYSEHPAYRWLNDTVCGYVGEVRSPPGVPREQVQQPDVKLLLSVAELVWEPPPE